MSYRLLSALLASPVLFAADCAALRQLSLPHAVLTLAESVPAGSFSLPTPDPRSQAAFQALPAFCRVAATLQPSPDSDIRIEVWLPASGWNGKFMGVGNGGWSGAIVYSALASALARGYAAASTNTGHNGSDATFVPGHPEKLADFGFRAVHEMTVAGKAFTQAFYGTAPAHAYWNGCSSGGKQGLKEAQKFPADYDGIIAGAPANYWTHLMAGDLWPALAVSRGPASALPLQALRVLHQAALAACDNLDGAADGLIENPAACRFDPIAVLCRPGQATGCLTAPQVEAARQIYAGAHASSHGKPVFPGMPPGGELGWTALAGPKPFAIPESHFRYVVFNNPAWDFRSLDLHKDVTRADKLDAGLLNATDPNLKKFFGRGGKLLMYHGWNDQLITPLNSIDYYGSVAAKLGGLEKISHSFRLFLAPGMNHCSGGEGPSRVDYVSALEHWVEQGQAPDSLLASQPAEAERPARSRPLCPYPQVARYNGQGPLNQALSFACVAPPR